jgi:hypothetical protein
VRTRDGESERERGMVRERKEWEGEILSLDARRD